tara:strand:+ start:41 stop:421 length:381 start_codon:yes stop_codon:yes gene_type:complete
MSYEENIINKQIQLEEKFSKLDKKAMLTTDETVYLYTDVGEYAISFEFTEDDGEPIADENGFGKLWISKEQLENILNIAKKIITVKDLNVGDWFYDNETDNKVVEKRWSFNSYMNKPVCTISVYSV